MSKLFFMLFRVNNLTTYVKHSDKTIWIRKSYLHLCFIDNADTRGGDRMRINVNISQKKLKI